MTASPDPNSPRGAEVPLFRRDALEHASGRRHGSVRLARPVSFAFLTLLFGAIAVGLLGFFAGFGYTRKTHASGVVLPRQGALRLVAPQAGVVVRVGAREGDPVAAGALLFELASERISPGAGDAGATIAALLRVRRSSLLSERDEQRELSRRRSTSLAARAADLKAEIRRVDAQRSLQQSRVALAEQALVRHRELQQQQFVAAAAVQERSAELIDQQQRLGDLDRARAAAERELAATVAQSRELEVQARRDIEVADRGIASLDQEIAENDARRSLLVRAPSAGVLGALTVQPGQSVGAAQNLATLLPSGAGLDAELYVPSRAIGFVRTGMPVLLRYQAFAFQKFGQQTGRVREVSRMALRAEDLPIPSAAGGAPEPLYRVRVTLDSQTVRAFGEDHGLRPGMAVDASILLEHRKLYEWVLDPLYSVTGRV